MNTNALLLPSIVFRSGFIGNILLIPAILLSTTLHEYVRAMISTRLGDPTPTQEGRLTLNPKKHFEPIGFLLMYATSLSSYVGFGWGKPVNTNSRYYSNRKGGVILTATLPNVANLVLAVVSAYCLKYLGDMHAVLLVFFAAVEWTSIGLIVSNLFPVAPFDCLKVVLQLVDKKRYFSIIQMESVSQLVLILLLLMGVLGYITLPLYRALFFITNVFVF